MQNLRNPRFYRFLTGEAFDILASSLFMMALPWQMLKQGANGRDVALLALVCTVISFLLTPFISTLVDRNSRRALLTTVQGVKASAALALLLVAMNGSVNLWLMGLVQILFWICGQLTWAALSAFQQEVFLKNEYRQLSSYAEIVMQSCTLVSAGLGIYLLERWDMLGFSAFAAFMALASALFYRCVPYQRKVREQKGSKSFIEDLLESRDIVRRNPEFILFITLSCLSYPMLTYIGKLVPILFNDLGYGGQWVASWTLLYGAGALLLGATVTKLLDRFAYADIMLNSMKAMAVVLVLMGLVVESPLLLAGFFIIGILAPLNRIARTVWMNHDAKPGERGRIDGILALFSSITQSISYVLIALLATVDKISWGFTAFAVFMFASVLAMQRLRTGGKSKGPGIPEMSLGALESR